MNRTVMLGCMVAALAGCSQQSYKGRGEYFELMNVNLIERDLSVFTPTQVAQTPDVAEQVAPKKPKKPLDSYVVRVGERYQVALKRWIRDKGYPSIAWSMNEAHSELLDTESEQKIIVYGSLKKAVSELADRLDMPIHLIVDEKEKVVGVYDFEGKARITHVAGKSLKTVTQRVVENYHYRWVDSTGPDRSWLVPSNYQFSADYYLLTRNDDIDTALNYVLDDYPVYSSIVESTGQVLIQE